MIAQLTGTLVEKNPAQVVVDCGGVGYLLYISLNTFEQIPETPSVMLYTHLIVRDDAHLLYGFTTKTEREIFKALISVSGIGASIAMTMLSSLSPQQVVSAIASEDVKTIQSIKGIGLKTAQRVVIELKEKIVKVTDSDEVFSTANNTVKNETLSALETLGFNRKLALKTIEELLKEHPDLKVEGLLKLALKKL